MNDDFHGMKVLASCGRGGFGEVCYCEATIGAAKDVPPSITKGSVT